MLTLKIVSSGGSVVSLECDSVHLTVSDNDMGQDGGSMGIRQGHITSIISLDTGNVTAYLEGKEIYSAVAEGGFATVEDDCVTVVTQKVRNAECGMRN